MLSKRIFQFVKQKIPRISDTELIALRSGNTSLDRDIFKGIVDLPKKKQIENKLPENMVGQILSGKIYPKNEIDFGRQGTMLIMQLWLLSLDVRLGHLMFAFP